MQVIDDPYRSLGASVGGALGKGLAESIPREMDRMRLSRSLDQLKSGDFNPLDATQSLIKGGASDAQLQALLPIIERAYRNRQMQGYAKAQAGMGGAPAQSQLPPGQASITPTDAVPGKEPVKPVLQKILTPESERSIFDQIRPFTESERQLRALELQNLRPGLPDFTDYLELADKERSSAMQAQDAQRREYESRSALRNNLLSSIEEKTKTKISELGKDDLLKEATGTFYNKVNEEAEDKVARREMTVEEAARWASDRITRFANKRLDVKKKSNSWFPSDLEKYYKNAQREYAKEGLEKVFEDELVVSGKLSRGKAAELAYPTEKNKKLNEWIEKSKPPKGFGVSNERFGTYAEVSDQISRAKAEQLPKYLKPNDSLIAVAKKLEQKGYDPNVFLDQLNVLYNNGMLKNLTDDQIDQLTKINDFKSSWGDTYINWW